MAANDRAMQPLEALWEDSSKRLARAIELHANASAARQRSKLRKQDAEVAKAIMHRLCRKSVRWIRNETVLEMTERRVVEAERHVEY